MPITGRYTANNSAPLAFMLNNRSCETFVSSKPGEPARQVEHLSNGDVRLGPTPSSSTPLPGVSIDPRGVVHITPTTAPTTNPTTGPTTNPTIDPTTQPTTEGPTGTRRAGPADRPADHGSDHRSADHRSDDPGAAGHDAAGPSTAIRPPKSARRHKPPADGTPTVTAARRGTTRRAADRRVRV